MWPRKKSDIMGALGICLPNDRCTMIKRWCRVQRLKRLSGIGYHMILEQMHTIDLTGKTGEEIITIITNVGRTVEKWDVAGKKLRLKKSISEVRREIQRKPRFEKQNRFDWPKTFKNKFQGCRDKRDQSDWKFKLKRKSTKTYAEQPEGIEKSELDRRNAAGECQRCAWPGARKGAHNTMDCFRWPRKGIGTAPFPKAKDYQKLKVGAHNQEDDSESEIDLYTTDDDKEDASDREENEEPDSEQEDEL